MKAARVALVIPLWLAAGYALRLFLEALWAPDICLDSSHGSFDYRSWQCSEEQQLYVPTALYDVPGFWRALLSVVVSIGGTVVVNRFLRKDKRC
jgi:hypothetical protein